MIKTYPAQGVPEEIEALPSATAIEREVVGHILITGSIPPRLRRDCFTLEDLARVFDAADTLYARGEPIDRLSIHQQMGQPDIICDRDALDFLFKLGEDAVPGQNIENHVSILIDKAMRRRVIRQAAVVDRHARLDTRDTGRLVLSAAEAFSEMAQEAHTPTSRIIENLPSVWGLEATVEWHVENLYAKGTVNLLTGMSGLGKSTLGLQLAGDIAHGHSFLNFTTAKTPVVYIDRENPLFVVKERLERMKIAETPKLIIWGTWCNPFPNGPASATVLDFAREYKPFIIFDVLAAFHEGNEQDATETRKHMTGYRVLASAGATVLVLHHSGKSEGSKQYRGSSDILGSVDTGILLEPAIPGEWNGTLDNLRLTPFKTRFAPMKTMRLQYVDGRFYPTAFTEESPYERFESVLRMNPNSNGTQLVELCHKKGVAKNKVEDFLLEGVKAGRIIIEVGSRGAKKYRLGEPEL